MLASARVGHFCAAQATGGCAPSGVGCGTGACHWGLRFERLVALLSLAWLGEAERGEKGRHTYGADCCAELASLLLCEIRMGGGSMA